MSDNQNYVNDLLLAGEVIGLQNAGDQPYTRLSAVDALADLSPGQVSEIVTMYNQQNDADHLPDATIRTDENGGLFITFNDPEVPTTVRAQETPTKEKQIGNSKPTSTP